MPPKRKALGRGLDALLPSAPVTTAPPDSARAVLELDIDELVPNPYQPRASVDEEALAELVDSIRAQGVLQPILVRRVDRKYQVVAGERRWRAAKLAAMQKIPAIVVDPSETEMLEWALLENIQREDLNAIEEARAYQTLLQEFGLSQEEVARRVGKRRSSVANSLRLLKLPVTIQREIADGTFTAGHGRALLAVNDTAKQQKLREEILRRNLSVRQAEDLANKLSKAKGPGRRKESAPDPQLRSLAEQLSESLAAKVAVKPASRTRGKVEIYYHSLEDLDRILEHILGTGRSGLRAGS
jgi:ParB family chromosome partitioning protein